MGVSRKLSNGLNLAAASLALYAALFYWTRGWIEFTPQSLPWLLYTLLPYVAFWILSKNLQTQGASNGRNVVFIIAAIGLLFITAYTYLQFMDGYMVFYLRQFLFIIPLVNFLGVLLVVGIGALMTRKSRPQSGAS